jgi:hypothetical protein
MSKKENVKQEQLQANKAHQTKIAGWLIEMTK